jgi:putative FmdB family regulatory protein
MLHEYVCTACGDAFEELVRSSEDPDDVSCPTCGTPRAKRVVLAKPTFHGCGGDGGSAGAGGASGGGCSGFV